jgi:acetyl esterase/lipase
LYRIVNNTIRGNAVKTLIAAALAGVMCMAGQAAAAPVSADVAPKVVSTDSYPARQTPFAGGVTGLADLTYATIPGYQPLKLDLYLAKAGGPKPLVIYVHGGGWTGGTSRNAAAFSNFPAVLADIAARGYVVASLNYRLSGEARFPAAAQDVDAAIRWLRAHAAEYGIDKSKVGIWGGSAGGQLAALAATDCGAGEGESDCVQSAVIWYGVFDFGTLPQRAAPGADNAYLGCKTGACDAQNRAASPVTFLDAKDPPMLLIAGTDDRQVPVTQSREMIAKLKAAGVKSEFIELPDTDHSWIGKTPEATRAMHLKALQATVDWFDATLKK